MNIRRVFVAALWPCFILAIYAIIFLNNEKYDQSSGMGAAILLCILPIIYFINFSILFFIYKVIYNYISILLRRVIIIFVSIGVVFLLYLASNAVGSDSRLLYLAYSMICALVTILPMVIFVEFGIAHQTFSDKIHPYPQPNGLPKREG